VKILPGIKQCIASHGFVQTGNYCNIVCVDMQNRFDFVAEWHKQFDVGLGQMRTVRNIVDNDRLCSA
jgi:hypothetical protein